MLFKKSEPRRSRPTMALTVGALTVIGAVTVGNAVKSAFSKIKSKVSSMCGAKSCDGNSSCFCESDEDQY